MIASQMTIAGRSVTCVQRLVAEEKFGRHRCSLFDTQLLRIAEGMPAGPERTRAVNDACIADAVAWSDWGALSIATNHARRRLGQTAA